MPDIPTLLASASAGVAVLKGAADTANSVKDLLSKKQDVDPELKAAVSEVLDQVIAAKVMNAQLVDSIDQLKNELSDREQFNAEMEKYQLVETQQKNILWELREMEADGGPKHFLCPNCIEEKSKSILQGGDYSKRCPRCETTYSIKPHPPIRARSTQGIF